MQKMSRQSDLNKSFKLSVYSMNPFSLPAPNRNFEMHLLNFSTSEKVSLQRLFIQVITCLHGNIEAGAALDTVEQLVEDQGLDPLFSEKLEKDWKNIISLDSIVDIAIRKPRGGNKLCYRPTSTRHTQQSK